MSVNSEDAALFTQLADLDFRQLSCPGFAVRVTAAIITLPVAFSDCRFCSGLIWLPCEFTRLLWVYSYRCQRWARDANTQTVWCDRQRSYTGAIASLATAPTASQKRRKASTATRAILQTPTGSPTSATNGSSIRSRTVETCAATCRPSVRN